MNPASQFKKIKVAMLITTLTAGGAERYLLRTLQHLDRSKFDVMVISIGPMGEIGHQIQQLGITVLNADVSSPFGFLSKWLWAWIQLRKFRPNVLHAWMYHAMVWSIPISFLKMSLKKCRVIWSIRNAQLNSGSLPKSTLLLARLLAKYSSHVDSLVYNSTVAQKTHEQMGYDSKKSIVIHNGFDLNHLDRHSIESLRQDTLNLYDLKSKVRYIGFVSRNHPQKDIQTFLNVAKILQQQKERVKFITCGNGLGPHDSDFLDQLKSYGIQDAVCPLGVVENISDLYSCFDALLLTSKEESLPNVIGEAMACGVPCMSTRVGDVEHLLHSDQLSEIGDSEGLSYHLLKILDAPKSERQIIIQRQKETLKHHFNILKQQEQLEQLYLKS